MRHGFAVQSAPVTRARAAEERSSAAPEVSVVVPTFKRPAMLERCLKALLQQRFNGRYEIVVVDDAHSDATRRQLEQCAPSVPPYATLRYLRPDAGRGPAVARNAGWRAARGSVIAFTDDDTIPRADWLAQGVQAMRAAGAGCAALAGRVIVPPTSSHAGAAPTDHELMTRGLERADFVTASAFVRRDALVSVGGFDERFRRAWREDSDLQFRLQAQVGTVGRCAGAAVLHPVRPERWGVSLRQQKNVFYDALLYRKHPKLYRERVRRTPPWDYYAVVVATAGAFGAWAGVSAWPPAAWLAWTLAGVAAVLVTALIARRLRSTAKDPVHVAEMVMTSVLIPFLSVYWRMRGAFHFRVWFL